MKELEVAEDVKPKWYNAVIPVSIVVVGTIAGLFYTGWDTVVWNDYDISFIAKISTIIGNADSFKSLVWSSMCGVIVALFLTTTQKILSLKDSIEGLINGFKTMFHAILILSLAWSLALITKHLHTAEFITGILTRIEIAPQLIPALTFFFSAAVAFSTGSSWGTMAIIYPLIMPATWKIGVDAGLAPEVLTVIFYNVVSSVLAGSVMGDHCSPISDTTILSSLSSSCNHINHVKTQMPYAITVGAIGMLAGTIPAGYGLPLWVCYIASIGAIVAVINVLGKRIE